MRIRPTDAEFRHLLQTLPDQICLVSENGEIDFVNRETECPLGPRIGKAFVDTLPDEQRETATKAIEYVFRTQEPTSFEFRSPDDPNQWWLTRAAPLSEQSPAPDSQTPSRILLVTTDTSDRKRLEAQVRQQQKLEAIGLLASGVAHEVNNPINSIMNFAALLRRRLNGSAEGLEFTNAIIEESRRVADIVRNLLSFARQDKNAEAPIECSIDEIIASTVSLIGGVLRHDHIEVKTTLTAPTEVICRRHQIQQVLMNLMTNARDALNDQYEHAHPNKRITISTEVLETLDADSNLVRWLRVTVSDEGPGISAEHLERIFDPFFTTKDPQRGTGLGLSVSIAIAEEHGGSLSADNHANGARFHLDLPIDNGDSWLPPDSRPQVRPGPV